MNAVLCPVNPIGHEWNALACRWCPATRTAAEAIVSGLASRRGGDEDTARALLGTHRTEVYVEALHHAAKAAAVIHQNCHRNPDVCAGCQVRADILDVLTSVADVIAPKTAGERRG